MVEKETMAMEMQQGARSNYHKRSTLKKHHHHLDGYRLVDMDIFSNIINCLACPKSFDSNMVVEDNYEKKKGLASLIHISCNNCDFSKESYTSKTLKKRRS